MNREVKDRMMRRDSPGELATIGTVTRWITDRGYGFLRSPVSPGQEIFCHRSSIRGAVKDLQAGDQVMFCLEHSERGPRAVDVSLITR